MFSNTIVVRLTDLCNQEVEQHDGHEEGCEDEEDPLECNHQYHVLWIIPFWVIWSIDVPDGVSVGLDHTCQEVVCVWVLVSDFQGVSGQITITNMEYIGNEYDEEQKQKGEGHQIFDHVLNESNYLRQFLKRSDKWEKLDNCKED